MGSREDCGTIADDHNGKQTYWHFANIAKRARKRQRARLPRRSRRKR